MISCGGGGSGGGGEFRDINLTADVPWIYKFTVNYDVDSKGGPFGALALELQDNLSGIVFSPQGAVLGLSEHAAPLAENVGQMTVRIAAAEAYSTVCTDGEVYGPFEITLDESYQPSLVAPSTASASQTTTDIINVGAFSVCVEVVSPLDAIVDVNNVDYQLTQCADSPAAIAGTWTGPFSCGGDCGYTGTVTLWITQDDSDPSIASYTDYSGGSYNGTVCGNRFSFRGGGEGYNESGTFVMDPGGETATKTSTFVDLFPGTCYGTCNDVLARPE